MYCKKITRQIFSLFLLVLIWLPLGYSKLTPLEVLMNDFMKYSTTNVTFHGGDLFEHSVWVAMTVKQWFREHNKWIDGLTYDDQRCAVFAALIHDVGKGGDHAFVFDKKPTHDSVGQDYILGIRPYILASGRSFDFNALFRSLDFSEQEQRFISILVAAHSNLGWAMWNFSHDKLNIVQHYGEYVSKIINYMDKAKYDGPFNSRMLRMIMLLSAADVRGALPCACCRTLTMGALQIKKVPMICHYEAPDKFNDLKYDTDGFDLRNQFINIHLILERVGTTCRIA